eukprot:CAMPEP_0170488876 /NCGR_PEP_ID=MMETSP0208-20121228/7323_1 /TAXON_ID=197538 /ORGANISM="Strombidium inclinatum, Strain S3" /LENGTH=48 /DNA_ID= /DNA_START= /DNA_END= /DNA_ORIENTATION=
MSLSRDDLSLEDLKESLADFQKTKKATDEKSEKLNSSQFETWLGEEGS